MHSGYLSPSATGLTVKSDVTLHPRGATRRVGVQRNRSPLPARAPSRPGPWSGRRTGAAPPRRKPPVPTGVSAHGPQGSYGREPAVREPAPLCPIGRRMSSPRRSQTGGDLRSSGDWRRVSFPSWCIGETQVEEMADASRAAPLRRFRCTRCGYGATCRREPEQCPMCQRSEWFDEGWSPFSGLDGFDSASAPLAREADAVRSIGRIPRRG
jgi:hypothetical protein